MKRTKKRNVCNHRTQLLAWWENDRILKKKKMERTKFMMTTESRFPFLYVSVLTN